MFAEHFSFEVSIIVSLKMGVGCIRRYPERAAASAKCIVRLFDLLARSRSTIAQFLEGLCGHVVIKHFTMQTGSCYYSLHSQPRPPDAQRIDYEAESRAYVNL